MEPTAKLQMKKYFLVTSTVALTLLSAATLDFAAGFETAIAFLPVLMIALAFSFNIGKFLIWGFIHRRYRISQSYIVTAVFFPLVFLLGILTGDAEFATKKLVGIILIVTGIYFSDNRIESALCYTRFVCC